MTSRDSIGRPLSRAKRAGQRSRQPTEIRRRLIVEAARTVIAERGLFATTMRDIAQGSDVSLGTVTYHFTGLDEILAEVIEGEMEHFYVPIVTRAEQLPDARGAMRAILDGFFAADERTLQHWLLWLDFWALAAHDRAYADRQSVAYQSWRKDVTTLLQRGVDDGSFAVDDVHLATVHFLAIFDGLAAHAYLPGAELSADDARRQLYDYVNKALLASGTPALIEEATP